MKTRHTSIFLLLWALLFSVPLSAQDMTVRSMKLDITDVTGSLAENLVPDNNGNYGGLVRVYLPAPNATFEGAVLRQQKHSASEYWVVVAKDYYRLKVVVPGFQPLDVNFRDYNITGIESQRTYVLTINVPQLLQAGPVDDGMRYLAMSVDPKNATVLVDGKPQAADENGEVVVRLPKGSHGYQVSAVGYETKEGTVSVGDNNDPLTVQLVSTKATLRVECATNDADIFVNNQLKGKSPWSGQLMSGQYLVEARLKGYRTGQQSISLEEKENRTVKIPALAQINGSLSVECRPIGSEVYVDGKKVGTSPNIFRNIAVGNRSVEIRKEGYEPLRKTVEVKENEQASLTGSLTAVATSTSQSSSASNGTSIDQKIKNALKVGLFSLEDSMAYSIGYSSTVGLNNYLSSKLNVDTTLISEIRNGILYSVGMINDTYPVYKGEQQKAFNAGIQVGSQIDNQIINNINHEIFDDDSTRTISKKHFMAGFVDALESNTSKMTHSIANQVSKTTKQLYLEQMYVQNRKNGEVFLERNKHKTGVHTTASGLQYKIVKEGRGGIPKSKSTVTVNYEGRFMDGTVFDSTYKIGKPMSFKCNQVIKGWQEALTMMPIGSIWELYIPQELAYGSKKVPKIKPFSMLIFTVELISSE